MIIIERISNDRKDSNNNSDIVDDNNHKDR